MPAAGQLVPAQAALDRVVAVPALDAVGPGVADQHVGAAAAGDVLGRWPRAPGRRRSASRRPSRRHC